MVSIPSRFSLPAISIRGALQEGRVNDAKTMVIDLLRAGRADAVVQGIAADLLRPGKRSRGRPRTLPKFWMQIGEEFERMRDTGNRYEETVIHLSEKFGYSETHVRNAVRTYRDAVNGHANDNCK